MLDLEPIKARRERVEAYRQDETDYMTEDRIAEALCESGEDVPALVAEVETLRECLLVSAQAFQQVKARADEGDRILDYHLRKQEQARQELDKYLAEIMALYKQPGQE